MVVLVHSRRRLASSRCVVTVPTHRLDVVGKRAVEVVTTALGNNVDLQTGTHRGRSIDTAATYLDISDHVSAHLQVSRLGITIPNGTLSFDLDDVRKVLCGVAKIDHTTTVVIKRAGVNAGGHLKEICPRAAIPSRTIVLKPANAYVIVYSPGGKFTKR